MHFKNHLRTVPSTCILCTNYYLNNDYAFLYWYEPPPAKCYSLHQWGNRSQEFWKAPTCAQTWYCLIPVGGLGGERPRDGGDRGWILPHLNSYSDLGHMPAPSPLLRQWGPTCGWPMTRDGGVHLPLGSSSDIATRFGSPIGKLIS